MLPSPPVNYGLDRIVLAPDCAGDLATIHASGGKNPDCTDLVFIEKAIVKTGPRGAAKDRVIMDEVFLDGTPFQVFWPVIEFVAVDMIDEVFPLNRIDKSHSNEAVEFMLLAPDGDANVTVDADVTFKGTARPFYVTEATNQPIGWDAGDCAPDFSHRILLGSTDVTDIGFMEVVQCRK